MALWHVVKSSQVNTYVSRLGSWESLHLPLDPSEPACQISNKQANKQIPWQRLPHTVSVALEVGS